jgi:hypothetical protein
MQAGHTQERKHKGENVTYNIGWEGCVCDVHVGRDDGDEVRQDDSDAQRDKVHQPEDQEAPLQLHTHFSHLLRRLKERKLFFSTFDYCLVFAEASHSNLLSLSTLAVHIPCQILTPWKRRSAPRQLNA